METNTNQEQQTEIQTPNIELPKGGGAIRSMGETFQPNAFSGTGSYSIPVPITPARGFEPELSIDYNSGAGNSEWGIGFSLSLPKISRRTEKGIPKYDDSDIFIAGTGELTPKLVKKNGELVRDIRTESLDNEKWNVYAYLPRIEGAFSQIEQWINADGNDSFWKIISRNNTIDIFGKTKTGRIYNPEDHNKIFEWLIEESI
ncbi:MAG: hypothetical protein GY757_23315, partial [bacterium]|nr:hypothetical protein [bacterium]